MPKKKKDTPSIAEKGEKEYWKGSSEKTDTLQKLHKKMKWAAPGYGAGLEAQDVVEEQPGLILVVEDFLTGGECANMIEAMQAAGLNTSTKSDLTPKKGEAFLDRHNLTFTDPHLSEILWERLAPQLPDYQGRQPTGFNPSFRYYCYEKGQRFGEHVDTSVRMPTSVSEYTLLIYLNSEGEYDLLGGETVFHATKKKVLLSYTPKRGALLLHAHGSRCLMHEGAEVLKGKKFVFRTDVMYGKGK
eukprot:TRINITY_DN22280_c0_g1_i1.p1 TRINITY_DN22280_c0_g1~~TRINITY_DN22280_c0_g1_i1.p1  ORF type:complete len:262 (+),score=81.29 TRINITY_DN22280_c0_g1_i1:56-787(+)